MLGLKIVGQMDSLTHCSVLAKESKGKTLGFVFR